MKSSAVSFDETASFSTHTSNNEMLYGGYSDHKNNSNNNNNGMRSVITLAVIIVFFGLTAGCIFASIGWRAEQNSVRDGFERGASVTVAKISDSFDDYQSVASLIHGQCRHRPQFDASSLLEDRKNYTNYYNTWSGQFRSDFRKLYEYVAASGLNFKAMQFDPNITSFERLIAEEEATEYYKEYYPDVNYTGFRGFNGRSTSLEPRWYNQSFYFPIHYQEPISGNEAAIDLDYYSSESRTRAVNALFETEKPSLTDRLSLVKKAGTASRCIGGNDPHADDEGPSFGVVLMHPGVKLPEDDGTSWPKDFSSIVLCVPDLLRRSAIHQKRKVSVYIHDISHPTETDPVFMGAVRLIPTHPDDYSNTGRYKKENSNDMELVYVEEEETITMQLLEEFPLVEELQCLHDYSCYQETISIANREWIVTVLDEDEPDRTRSILVVMIGIVVFAASIGLAVWVIANDRRNRRYAAIKSKAAAERTSLILDNANNAARTERELNDFLAHEVRNPLAAAMAATQFLRTELDRSRKRTSTKSIAVHFKDEDGYESDGDSINNDNSDDNNDDCDHRQVVSLESPVQALNSRDCSTKSDTSSRLLQAREDVRVVDHALRFINDLLRNMLDMHRASSRQLQVNMSPVDLLRDVIEPVAGMLQRGGERNGSRKSRADDKVQILVDCPENLFVMTDPLRLKQVLLNLGRNSVKFIHEGFIRLRAEVVVVDNNNGATTINGCDPVDIEAGKSTPPNSIVRLYVEDSGSGIPFEKRERLFAKYQESLDLLSQGTGIGLHLCKNLVDLMGGEISLDNEYDSGVFGYSGARFIIDLQSGPVDLPVITFPLFDGDETDDDDTDDDVSNENFKKSEGSGITHGMDDDMNSLPHELPETLKILFVDDDSVLRKLFTRSIKRVCPGWTIREAANGETAILLAEEEDFDLIFCDMYMASVEKQLLGTETVAELRAKGITCRICGLSANDKEIEFLEAGSDTFHIKPMPCEANALKQTLYRVLYAEHRSYH